MEPLELKVEIFCENDMYVALCSDLNVSSYGDSVESAKQSLKEAIEAFIEECFEMGTLEEVLNEAGLTRADHTWRRRQPLPELSLALAV